MSIHVERTKPLSGGMLWMAAVVLAGANFMAMLDMTIANVSVPSIAGGLAISATQGTWVITSYSVAEAIVVPLTGWLASRFGAVRVFATAMALFGAFSAACGVSESLAMLVGARVLQGLAGGPLIPLSQTLLLRIFPKEKAGMATALWAMTTLFAPVLGPLLGGWICDSYSWPLIFFINVPLALLCAPVAWLMLARYETPLTRSPIDYVGLALMIVFVTALQVMLDLGKDRDWLASGEIRWLAAIALVGFAAFLIWELTEKHPIVDVRIFRHRGFTASVITLSLGFGAMFGVNVLTPLWLQSYMGYTSTWAGRTTAWTGVLAVVFAPLVGMLVARVDPRKLVFGGLLWLAAMTALRSYSDTDLGYWQIALPLLLMGAGLPFFFVPLTTLSLGSVEEHEMASAAGLQNFLRTLSGAIATSLVTTLWENKTSYRHEELTAILNPAGDVFRALAQSGLSADAGREVLDRLVQGQGVMLATNEMMMLVASVYGVSAFMIWMAKRPTRMIDPSMGGH